MSNVEDIVADKRPIRPVIHPAYVRVTHWINALAILIMIGSGWEIYNASPLFGFTFPRGITLGGWLAGALLWHFAAMWLLIVNGLVYVTLGFATGRFRRKLLPIRAGEIVRDLRAAFWGRLSHDDLTVYNAVQKALYTGVSCSPASSSSLPAWRSGNRCSSSSWQHCLAATRARGWCISSPWPP